MNGVGLGLAEAVEVVVVVVIVDLTEEENDEEDFGKLVVDDEVVIKFRHQGSPNPQYPQIEQQDPLGQVIFKPGLFNPHLPSVDIVLDDEIGFSIGVQLFGAE